MKPSSRKLSLSALASLSCGIVVQVVVAAYGAGAALAHATAGVAPPMAAPDALILRPPVRRPGGNPRRDQEFPGQTSWMPGQDYWINVNFGPEQNLRRACLAASAGPKIITLDNRPAPRARHVRVTYGVRPCGT